MFQESSLWLGSWQAYPWLKTTENFSGSIGGAHWLVGTGKLCGSVSSGVAVASSLDFYASGGPVSRSRFVACGMLVNIS